MEVPLLGGLVFVALALLSVGGALMVALSKNIVHSAFSLLAAFFGVAGLYMFLAADFVAMVQIMVYVGGVLILFLFAVMLTGQIQDVKVSNLSQGRAAGALVLLVTVGLLGYVAFQHPFEVLPAPAAEPTTAQIGDALLGPYVLPFEVASVLLLAALVGGVMIASRLRSGGPSATDDDADGGAA